MSPPCLDVTRLSKSLAHRLILRGVDLTIPAGQIHGLIGPNGSGKSTLFRCCVGMWHADQGQVQIGGHDLEHDPLAAKRAFGFAPNPEALPSGLRVQQVLSVYARARGLDVVPEQSWSDLERLGAARWRDSFVHTLSLGTRQKLAVVMALMQRPKILLLDEVFNGLDPSAAYELKLLLLEARASHGCGVLLATHGLELAIDLLDDMSLLHEGRIVHRFGEPELHALKTKPRAEFERVIVERFRTLAH